MIAASQAKPMDLVKASAPFQASTSGTSTTELDLLAPPHSSCSTNHEHMHLTSLTDLLSVHPVKVFPMVWDVQFAPKNMGTGGHCYYMCTAPNCDFRALKIGLVWLHVAVVHTMKEAVCPECAVLFLSPYSMREYMFLHFPECKPSTKSSSK